MAFFKVWGRLLRRMGRRAKRTLTDRPALRRFLRPRRLPLSMESLEDRIAPAFGTPTVFNGLPFTGAFPPDTVGDIGPDTTSKR